MDRTDIYRAISAILKTQGTYDRATNFIFSCIFFKSFLPRFSVVACQRVRPRGPMAGCRPDEGRCTCPTLPSKASHSMRSHLKASPSLLHSQSSYNPTHLRKAARHPPTTNAPP